MPPEVFGTCDQEFSKVEKVFRKSFLDGWEREGASISIYHKGKLVVDLYGGYADKHSRIPWTKDTKTVVFSASKAVGALIAAMLVDRGYIKYEDKISKFWPEFAQNGKSEITFGWIMSHKAGLAVFDEHVTIEDAKCPKRMAAIIERTMPNWMPGTKSGYHAFSYGWLLDQICRRVDPKGRSVEHFIREEINEKYDVDFVLGLAPDADMEISRISLPDVKYQVKEIIYDPRVLLVIGILNLRRKRSLAYRIVRNHSWLRVKKNLCTFNNPEVLRVDQIACSGISTARDLGKIFALMLSEKLIKKEILDKFKRPEIVNGFDVVVGVPISKGYGFMYEKHPKKSGRWLYGHPGFGGTTVMVDPEDELVIAYVSNGLKTGMGEITRTYRLLRNAALDCV
ncbi:beta-lactamase domain-containing protein [Ditylenchus destructor]|uniref:Beta-lactamase domain-containing protein n=1 Tax=Ditylenchus destructor TaxID=166010 RepID=A0AAD4MR79_9BILA|nr:beta-lactamase domain-containing protein [Ditylenchus destructor]